MTVRRANIIVSKEYNEQIRYIQGLKSFGSAWIVLGDEMNMMQFTYHHPTESITLLYELKEVSIPKITLALAHEYMHHIIKRLEGKPTSRALDEIPWGTYYLNTPTAFIP